MRRWRPTNRGSAWSTCHPSWGTSCHRRGAPSPPLGITSRVIRWRKVWGVQGLKRGGRGGPGIGRIPRLRKSAGKIPRISHHLQLHRSTSSTDWAPTCEENLCPEFSSHAGRNDGCFRGASLTDAHLLAATPQAQAPYGPRPGGELSGPEAGDRATPGRNDAGRRESRARNGGEHREGDGRGADHGCF